MSVAEKVVKERVHRSPETYATRVRWNAVIYFVLNLLSVAIAVTIVWRVKFFVTLAQRSNIETLVLAIIFVLAIYYIITTFKGFLGALRILWLNVPVGDARNKENRKHRAVKTGGTTKYVCFDTAIVLQGKPHEPIKWEVGDRAGKLGDLEVEGVKATYYPIKDGINDSIF